MQKRIGELTGEIETLERRQAELTSEIEEARAELEAAQEDVIEGKPGAGDRATGAQARLTAHVGALSALERRLEDKRSQLQAAEEAAHKADVRRQMEDEERRLAEADKAFQAAYSALREAFETQIKRIIESSETMDQARRQYRRLAQSIGEHDQMRTTGGGVPNLGPYGYGIGQAVRYAWAEHERGQLRDQQRAA